MIISIHQPEHFPYMGFFQKMSVSQCFVILDDVKFKKNDFQNRNRFVNRSGAEEWFTVPVEKNANSKLIKDVKVATTSNWQSKIKKQIFFNLKHDVSEIYDDKDSLIEINMASIEWCRKKMGIEIPMIKSSTLKVEGSKSNLLLNICKSLGATKYISGSGGLNYLDISIFEKEGIEVEFFKPNIKNMMSAIYNL